MRGRKEVEARTHEALQRGANVLVDRTNIDATQRSHWIQIANQNGANLSCLFRNSDFHDVKELHAHHRVPVDISFEELKKRLSSRQNHPTLKSPQEANGILQLMRKQWRMPSLAQEGLPHLYRMTEQMQTTEKDLQSCQRILNLCKGCFADDPNYFAMNDGRHIVSVNDFADVHQARDTRPNRRSQRAALPTDSRQKRVNDFFKPQESTKSQTAEGS